jgi:hypothetical protein
LRTAPTGRSCRSGDAPARPCRQTAPPPLALVGSLAAAAQGIDHGFSQVALKGSSSDASVVWNLPVDVTFKSTNPQGWPRLVVSVYCQDLLGRYVVRGYGSVLIPTVPGRYVRYVRCFTPESIHATCEDYRAAATIDLDHDRADLDDPIGLPVRVLWGEKGVVHACFDPLAEWRKVATDVTGRPMPTGHYIAEEDPAGTLAEIRGFLAG